MGGGIHLATMLKEHLENFAQLAVRGADMHRDRGGCKAFPPTPGDSQAQASALTRPVHKNKLKMDVKPVLGKLKRGKSCSGFRSRRAGL